MRHSLTLLLAGWLLLTSVVAPATAAESPAPSRVQLAGNLVTIKASDVPMNSLLEEIGLVAGIRVTVDPSRTEKVTVDLAGLPVDEAIRRVVKGQDAVFLWERSTQPGSQYRLAAARVFARGKGPAPARTTPSRPSVASRSLPEAQYRKLVEGLASSESLDRADAVVTLRDSGDPRAFDLIGARLGDADESVRLVAARSLLALGDSRATERLTQALSTEPLPVLRVEFARAMAQVAGPEAVAALRRASATEQEPAYRAAILEAAALADPGRARETLEQGLNDVDPHVRERANTLLKTLTFTRR